MLHFAAYAYVGESVQDPAKYYRNNLADSLTLLEALVEPVRTGTGPAIPIVFSSTCATYGIPDTVPISENTPQWPINPYGRSKWMVEQLLTDFGDAYGLPSVIFRYFNAAGADPAGDLGEDHTPETHLIPLVLEALAGRRSGVEVYGDDYPTPDGTCIRDYIHVCDLADAHVLGLKQLLFKDESIQTMLTSAKPSIYNLGTGSGFSVQQVLNSAKSITGKNLSAEITPRRSGDPPILVASAQKARAELQWSPVYQDLEVILRHAWNWHQRSKSWP